MKFEHCSSISFFRVAIHCTTGTSITITVQIIKANHFFFVFVFYMNSNHRIKSLFLFVFPNRHQGNTIHHFRKKKCDVKRKKLNQYKGGGQFGIVQKSAPNSRYLRSKFLWFLLSFFFLFFPFSAVGSCILAFYGKRWQRGFLCVVWNIHLAESFSGQWHWRKYKFKTYPFRKWSERYEKKSHAHTYIDR